MYKKNDNKSLGILGEDKASKFLSKNGYKILRRNYKCRYGEIDIIARKKKCIAFIEVKLRSKNSFGGPKSAVGKAKQNKIVYSALNFIKETSLKPEEISFDVIAILVDGKIEHIKNAFLPNRFSY